ncbi:MAG TPA: urate hydroxylase PuuD [Candidatus Acidoferrales bacterium]|nr:urate hydroxylase PuuD [Candidatus Acidoferrales bacterium]
MESLKAPDRQGQTFVLELGCAGQYHLLPAIRHVADTHIFWEPTTMPPAVSEWTGLILRWIHILAGIFWIGQTYYFTKLEGRMALDEEEAKKSGRPPQVWLVHSGSFSLVEKQSSLKAVPAKFYWFRWEALFTWISGFLLLGLLYYSGGLLLDDSISNIGIVTGVAIGLGTLFLGFAVYEGIWRSPLGRIPVLAGTICYLLVVALSYALTHLISGRAAYIHIGALFGTIMAANVWMGILPATRKMLVAIREGKPVDPKVSERAKNRTIHNTYMTVPVIFLMISNHFPTATYGADYNWLILSAVVLAGAVSAKFIYKAS